MRLKKEDICRCLLNCFRDNDYDGEDDYEFMLKMFNKRDKDSISLKQDKKIKALLLNAIKPFLQDRLAEKVR